VSIVALGHTFWQSWKIEKEELIIRIASNVESLPIRIPDINLGKEGQVIQLPFKMSVTNNCSRTLSLLEYRTFQLVGEGPIEENKKFYSGIDGGLFNLNGTEAKMPTSLSQGETIAYIVYVGILANKNVVKLLEPFKNKTLSRRSMYKVLGRNGTDIYGNKIEYQESTDGTFMFSVKGQANNNPIFVFQWTTGRGNKFVSLGGDYIFSEY
jgi:hypothetical protein